MLDQVSKLFAGKAMDVKTLDVLQNKIHAIHDDQRLKLELTQIGERFKNELASTLDGLDFTVERDTRHGCPYKIVFDANGRRYILLVRTVASKGHRHVYLHQSQLAKLEGQELDALAILTRSSEAADGPRAFQAIESCESMPWLKESKEAHASMAGFVERKLLEIHDHKRIRVGLEIKDEHGQFHEYVRTEGFKFICEKLTEKLDPRPTDRPSKRHKGET